MGRLFLVASLVAMLAMMPRAGLAEGCDANSPIINVKAFGAAGNGTTDDTQSIQNAAACFVKRLNSDDAHTAELYFPSGLYLIRAPIVIAQAKAMWKSAIIRGDGSAASRLVIDNTTDIFVVTLKSRTAEVGVRGLGFYTSKAARGGTAIHVVAPSGPPVGGTRSLVIKNVTIGSLDALAQGANDYFDYGIRSSSLNRPLIENVFMGNTYGPFATRAPKGAACFQIGNAYAPTIQHSACWKSRIGVDLHDTISGREAFSVTDTLLVAVGVGIRVSSKSEQHGGTIVDNHSNFYSAGFLITNQGSVLISGNLLYIQQPIAEFRNQAPRDIVLSNSPNATIATNISHVPGVRPSETDFERVAVTVGPGSNGARIEDNVFNSLGTGVSISAGVKKTSVVGNSFFVHTREIVNNGTDTTIQLLPQGPPR